MSFRTNKGGLRKGVRRNLIRHAAMLVTYCLYKISPRTSFEMTNGLNKQGPTDQGPCLFMMHGNAYIPAGFSFDAATNAR